MQSELPLITVALSAFNHEKFVAEALDSTLHSGLPVVELVVCDDASTDATSEIIRTWAEAHQQQLARFVFLQHTVNQGLCASLNHIVAEARGEIIHVLGTDDYFLPGGLAAKTKAILNNPSWAGAFCDGQAVGLEGELYAESLLASGRMKDAQLDATHMAEDLLFCWSEPANLHSWRRHIFKAHGGEFEWDPTLYCEDFEITMWAAARKALGFIPEVCQVYRCRSWPQVTNRPMQRVHRDIAHVLAKAERHFEPRLAVPLRNLREAFFKTAIEDKEAAEVHWRRHHVLRDHYLQGSRIGEPAVEYAPSPGPVPPPPETPLVSYARNAGDILLWRAFCGMRKGFYIDVGPGHPVDDSFTKLFYDLGWSGINVQPLPSLAQEFAVARPRDINLMTAVTEAHGVAQLHEITTAWNHPSRDDEAARQSGEDSKIREQVVNTETLAAICERHAAAEIHFLKIDAEGRERAVLQGANFQAFRPWLVLVAAPLANSSVESLESLETLLLENRYDFLWFDGRHRYFACCEKADQLRHQFKFQPLQVDQFIRHAESLLLAQWSDERSTRKVAEAKSQDAENRLRHFHAELSERVSAHAERVTRFKQQLSQLKEENARQGAEISRLWSLLRHHCSSPWRALRLWRRRKELCNGFTSIGSPSAQSDSLADPPEPGLSHPEAAHEAP